MKKINLEQKLKDIRGKTIQNIEFDENGKIKLDKDNKQIKVDATLRDYILTILGTKFPIIKREEVFWTTELGILASDKRNKIIEISDDKFEFLGRIFENNKTKRQLPMGLEKEVEIFFPFELGQILKIFNGEKENGK